MIITADINGHATEIHVDDPNAMSTVAHEGDKDNFSVGFGNGLVQVGGVLPIKFTNATESYKEVDLPFSKLYDFQVTGIDVQSERNEGVHIELLAENRVRIYAHVTQAFTGTLNVKWTALGVE